MLEVLAVDTCLVDLVNLRCRSRTLLVTLASLPAANYGKGLLHPQIAEIMAFALQLDARLQLLLKRLRQTHTYSTVEHEIGSSDVHDLIFNNKIHLYLTQEAPSLWNSYRAARMICNSVIVAVHHYGSSLFEGKMELVYKASEAKLSALINDVCESVSFHLLDQDPLTYLNEGDICSIKLNTDSCEGLIFALIVAMSTTGLDQPRKLWIKDKLRYMAKSMGNATVEMLASAETESGSKGASASHRYGSGTPGGL